MRAGTDLRRRNSSGQAIIEYVLVLALLGLIGAVGLHLMGGSSAGVFERIKEVFGGGQGTSEPASDNSSPASPVTTYLTDEFENLNNWFKINGPNCWKTPNGALVTTKDTCTSVLMNTTSVPADYRVTMNMAQLLSGEGYGLMFRLSKSQNSFTGYSFQVDKGYGNKFVFRRYDKNGTELGQPLAVADPPAGFDFSAPHQVSVSVVGNSFTAYVDGVQVLTASDSTYATGNTGLRTWGKSESTFDGFSVTSN